MIMATALPANCAVWHKRMPTTVSTLPISTQACRVGAVTPGTPARRGCSPSSLPVWYCAVGVGLTGNRANRGGSWNNKPARVRAANRNRNNPDNRNNNLGFRLVLPPSRPEMQSCVV
ncbi:hypothetical protein D5085_04035 [Ectothiorhodospiraceae bacterium BW-2]|nr:hypothetical protein D5085_04035 [Ectothiorhodospiraceae bacterium BW-2]